MSLKRGEQIKGYVRQDAKGWYVTNGSDACHDGDTVIRIDEKFNGAKVKIKIIKGFQEE